MLAEDISDKIFYNSPIGVIRLEATVDAIKVVSFHNEAEKSFSYHSTHPILKEAVIQLDEYFKGTRFSFQLPLDPMGTTFQQKVWNELLNIEYGVTATYLQLAKRLGNVKSIRAAAAANGKNPLAILIPCHRVVGADGKLTGYAGGLPRKQWLLEHEAKFAGQLSLFN